MFRCAYLLFIVSYQLTCIVNDSNICYLFCCLYLRMFAEDEFVESLSPATPRESTDIDDEQEKHLLSSSNETEDVTFVRESQAK